MPRIPDASSLGDRSIPRGRASFYQDRSGEIAADALGRAAGQIGAAVESYAAHDDQFNYARAKSTLLSADVEARKSLENDPDWETYEKRYTEAMGKAREKAAEIIRGKRSRSIFDDDVRLDIERGAGEIRAQARRKETDWGRSSLSEMLEANRTAALSAADEPTRASFVRSTNEAVQSALEKQYISTQEAVEHRKSWAESYAEGYLDTLPYEKQVEVLSKPEGTPAALLAPDKRANGLRQAQNQLRIERDRAEAERRASMIEVRQALTDQLRDLNVAAQIGLPVSVPSKDALKAAFGDREGEQRYQLAVKAANLSGDVSALQQLPTNEIVARVESYRPKSAEGAADQAQLYATLSSSARAIIKERMDDPAGYLTRFAPKTAEAWALFQRAGDEGSRDAYFSAIDADRERLGLPKGDYLPDSYAKSLAEELSNPKSSEQLASLMEAEEQKWGDRWPDVHSQLAKDLPDMAAVIGSGIDRAAAVTLASTAKLKDSELKSMLPPSTQWADVQDEVASAFDDVRRSFPAEGARTWQAIQDSATRLAVAYMQSGSSRKNAVDLAYKELIGNQYEIGEVRDVTFLVPKQFDAGDIEDEAQSILNEFVPTPDLIAAPQGEDPVAYLDRAKETFRENAYWVSRGDGNGLRMYLGNRPTPITYTFEQLDEMSKARRAAKEAESQRVRGAITEAKKGIVGVAR